MSLPAVFSTPARGDRPLAARRATQHFLTTKNEAWGLWRLGEAGWQYRPVDEQEGLLSRVTPALASMTGRRVKLRVTSRPVDADQWAASRQALTAHPLDVDQWNEHVERGRRRIAMARPSVAPQGFVETQAYLSVLLGKADLAKVADDDREVDGLLHARGLHARRALIEEQGWLMHRSVAPGHEARLGAGDWTPEDFADLSEQVRWVAAPFGRTVEVRVSRPEGVERRWVVVLSVGRMEDRSFPEDGSFPWLAFASRAGFPVEVVATGEIVAGRALASKVDLKRRYAEDIITHHEQMEETPPEHAWRSRDRAAEVHDELRNGSPATNARFHGVVRLVVVGDSEDEAIERSRRLAQAYREEQRIELVRPWDQVAALRELIPGEATVTDSFQRRLPVRYFAAGVPNVTGRVGNQHGAYLGYTTGDVPGRVVLHDSHHPMEHLNKGGLRPIIAQPGGGKSALACKLMYENAIAGVPCLNIDPPGETAAVCRLIPGGVHLDLVAARPGTFDTRRLIPMPDRQDFDDDAKYQAERALIPEMRQALLVDSLRALTAPSAQRRDGLEEVLGDSAAKADGDPWGTLEVLREQGVEWHAIADALARAGHGHARIMFPTPGEALDEDGLEDSPLVVISMNGMALPEPDSDRSRWGIPERASVVAMQLAIHYLRRFIYLRPRQERKVVSLDEAYWVAESPGGPQAVRTLSRDSRRRNTAGYIETQHGGDIARLDPSGEVFSSGGWAGRQEKPSAARSALGVFGVPVDVGYEDVLADLGRGEFLHVDDVGRIDQMYVDFEGEPELFEAINTTPDGSR